MLNKLASYAAAIAALVMLLAPAPAGAQPQVFPEIVTWTVTPSFNAALGNAGISGATCTSTEAPFRVCLAVSDVSNLGQIFKISGSDIVTGPLVRLHADPPTVVAPLIPAGNIDAEGVGYDADTGFFYVVGSRPRAQRFPSPVARPNQIIRFPINQKTGALPFKSDEAAVAPEVERTSLTAALQFAAGNAAPLDAGAVDIKGIAVSNERLYVGLRAPSLAGNDLIISVHPRAVFGPAQQAMDAKFHQVPLGANREIRDLARVETGILILAGPPSDAAGTNSLFHWDIVNNVLRHLADFADPTDRRAESLTVLSEDPEFFRVLVMFDGVQNGAPTQYHVPL